MNRRFLPYAIVAYGIIILLTIYNDSFNVVFVDLVSSLFWYRGGLYFVLYLVSPLVLFILLLFSNNNYANISVIFISAYLMALLLVNLGIEILYESDYGLDKLLYTLLSLVVFGFLLFVIYRVLPDRKTFGYTIVSIISVVFVLLQVSFHLLDSIPRLDKEQRENMIHNQQYDRDR